MAIIVVDMGLCSPVEMPSRNNDLPVLNPYQPEKAPEVPVVLGERSEGNISKLGEKAIIVAVALSLQCPCRM